MKRDAPRRNGARQVWQGQGHATDLPFNSQAEADAGIVPPRLACKAWGQTNAGVAACTESWEME